jgi:hypothetical protein
MNCNNQFWNKKTIVGKYHPSERVKRQITNPMTTKGVIPVERFGRITAAMRKYFPPTTDGKSKHKRMVRMGVNAMGTCFYHTIHALFDTKRYVEARGPEQMEMGRNFRHCLTNKIDSTWVSFWKSKGVEAGKIPAKGDIKKDLKNNKVWADIFTIIWTVQCVLRSNIIVFDIQEGNIYCGTHNPNSRRPTVLMAWISHSHFEPIFEYNEKHNTLRSCFAHNHPTLQFVLEKYSESQCPRVSLHNLLQRRRRRYGGEEISEEENVFPFLLLNVD